MQAARSNEAPTEAGTEGIVRPRRKGGPLVSLHGGSMRSKKQAVFAVVIAVFVASIVAVSYRAHQRTTLRELQRINQIPLLCEHYRATGEPWRCALV